MWSALHTFWRAIVLFFVCTVIAPVLMAGVVLGSFILLPLPATLPVPPAIELSQGSRVLDAQGNEVATFNPVELNIPVAKDQIPLVLKQAVVAAEDARFYEHDGVDLRGTTRALVRDIQGNAATQGGSTITQQYVKNTYTGADRTIIRKVKEAVLASQLDRQIDKDEILYRYLSIIFLGEGAYGVGAAAKTYFDKDVSQLTISEAAALAGVIPAPSRYSLRVHTDAAEGKRLIVLRKMLEQRYIDQAQYDAAVAAPLVLTADPVDPAKVTALRPDRQTNTKFPYFIDYVRRYMIATVGADALYRGGLTIQTTLDQDLQAQAEAIAADAVKGARSLKKADGTDDPIIMSLVSVEPGTGYVKALVGGQEYGGKATGQVNLALGDCPKKPDYEAEVPAECWGLGEKAVQGGGAGRQPGSSWKPITLAAAFEKGIPPTKVYPAPVVFTPKGCKQDNCKIRNAADGEGGGSMTLQQATTLSVNTVYAGLAQDIGIKAIAEMAKKLGIDQAWESPRRHGISYTLGAQEVSPLEMAGAYAVWANRGLRNPVSPVFVVRDKANNIVLDNRQPKNMRVVDEAVADNMNQVLQGPLDSGTARGKDLDRPAAGKTGTTDDYTSAWFVGYTPALSTAVYMGYRDPYLNTSPLKPASMINVKGVSRVFGGTIPAATWQKFMNAALKNTPATDFTQPAPIKKIQDEIDRTRRGGIDPGERRDLQGTSEGGPYVVGPATPQAPTPALPATAPPTSRPGADEPSSTTSTTRRNGGGIVIPGGNP